MTKFYETQAAPIAAEMPRQLKGKTAQEIVAYLAENYRTEFIMDEAGHITENRPQNKATAYMLAVSQAIFDPTDWKAPCRAWFPVCGDEWAKAAIVWYHGAEPISNGYWVLSRGYAC